MSYSQLREDMLLALYESARNDPDSEFWSFKDLAQIYDIEWQPGWLLELQQELRDEGLIRGPSNGQNDDMAMGRLSGAGLRLVEREHGTLDGIPTLIARRDELLVSVPLSIDGAASEATADEVSLTYHPPRSIDSSSWTGLPKQGVLTAQATEKLKVALRIVDDAVAGANCSNEERAQARAYALAIHALADAPEPPADLIWQLVSRANSIAGIAALFISLFAVFAHG